MLSFPHLIAKMLAFHSKLNHMRLAQVTNNCNFFQTMTVFSEDNRVLLILICREAMATERLNHVIVSTKNGSGLKNHKKQDKIPLCFLTSSANGFKAMRQAQDKQIKKRGCCVTVFWLYSPASFELDPQNCRAHEASDSQAFLAHVSVRAYCQEPLKWFT